MELRRIDDSDLYDDNFVAEIQRGARFVDGVARKIFTRCFAGDPRPYRELVGDETAAPQRNAFWFRKRLLDYLIENERVAVGSDGRLAPTPRFAEPVGDELAVDVTRDPGYVLLDQLADVVAGVLSGEDGFKAIGHLHGFGDALDRWISLMVDLPIRRPGTVILARALTERLRRGPTVVFEGGAGVGAILRHALAMDDFGRHLGNLERYHFTDISPLLLSIGQNWLEANAPALAQRTQFDVLDLDRVPLAETPYTREQSVDAVLLEGVLYDVHDLHAVLCAFRKMLRPGGILGFTMAYRQRPSVFFPFEMFQSSLHSYYRAKLDPPRRVNYGYITLDEWHRSLRDAGFVDYEIHPKPETHSQLLLGGIVAHV